VARNLTVSSSPQIYSEWLAADQAAIAVEAMLTETGIGCTGLLHDATRATSMKARIVAHQHTVVRLRDRETRADSTQNDRRLLAPRETKSRPLPPAVIIANGKGVVTRISRCESGSFATTGVWLSLDPNPGKSMNMAGCH